MRIRKRPTLTPLEEWTRIAVQLRAIATSEDWTRRDELSAKRPDDLDHKLPPGDLARTRIDFWLDKLLHWKRRNPDSTLTIPTAAEAQEHQASSM